MAPSMEKPIHIKQLDGLRGVAVLSVMLFHAGIPILKGGWIGVDLFFLLSGFLITSLLAKEFDFTCSIDLKAFYIRRVLRLAPALILLLAVFCTASLLFLNHARALSNVVDSLIALTYLSNWARAFDIHAPDYLGHTWSLSIEEQFYIVWPCILLVLLRTTRRRNVAIIAAIAALAAYAHRVILLHSGTTFERLYNGSDTRADVLMVGCVLGLLINTNTDSEAGNSDAKKALRFLAIFSWIGLLGICMTLSWRSKITYSYGLAAVELLGAIVLADSVLNPNSLPARCLRQDSLSWFGSLSYGLYLWHAPIYHALFDLGVPRIAVLILGTAATVAVSIFSRHLIELPALSLAVTLGANSKFPLLEPPANSLGARVT